MSSGERGVVVRFRREFTDVEIEERVRTLPAHQRQRLRELVRHLRATRDVLSQRASGLEGEGDLVEYLVWPEYSDAASELYVLLSRAGLVLPVDWTGWTRQASLLWRHAPADLSRVDAVRYVTVVVRGDRRGDGRFATAIIDGSLLHAIDAVLGPD